MVKALARAPTSGMARRPGSASAAITESIRRVFGATKHGRAGDQGAGDGKTIRRMHRQGGDAQATVNG